MKRFIGFGLAVLVNVLLVGAMAWTAAPLPNGKVLITDLSNDAPITVAARAGN